MPHNPRCDGAKCKHNSGEVRVLPEGQDSNSILCRACYDDAMRYRRERNQELAAANTGSSFELPSWGSLKVVDPETGDTYHTGVMLKAAYLVSTPLKLEVGQRVRLYPATNQPDKSRMFAAPIDGSWGDDSILLDHGDWQVDGMKTLEVTVTETTTAHRKVFVSVPEGAPDDDIQHAAHMFVRDHSADWKITDRSGFSYSWQKE
jgi:hypothetical protein